MTRMQQNGWHGLLSIALYRWVEAQDLQRQQWNAEGRCEVLLSEGNPVGIMPPISQWEPNLCMV